MPLFLVDLVTRNYPSLTTAFMPDIEVYVLFFGGMIVASSTLEASNLAGSSKRLVFGLAAVAFVGLWLYVMFGGGVVEFTYNAYHIRFDMTTIVYIMLLGVSLKALLVVQVFSSSREGFLNAKRSKEAQEARAAEARSRPRPAARAQRRAALPFTSMSKVDYDVTSDEEIVPAKPAGEEHITPEASRYKVCSVCGSRANVKDFVCKKCGAWFSKESFRFAREGPKTP